jgi:hypothetical protein
MALQGTYNFKGIELAEAYVKIDSINWSSYHDQQTTESSPRTYNEDGTVKSEATYETSWVENANGNWSAKVYKDQATRDANPNDYITNINGSFEMATNSTAKNALNQAYLAAKALDDYADYTDI